MARKVRSERPSLADTHFKAFAEYDSSKVLDRTDAPIGEWNIDDALIDIFERRSGTNPSVQEMVRKARFNAVMQALVALDRAHEDFQRQRERLTLHKQRTDQAKAMCEQIERFLYGSGADLSLFGVRGADFQYEFEAQWERDPSDNHLMEDIGRSYRQMLLNYIADRKPLDKAGTGAQWLVIRFAEQIIIGWSSIFGPAHEPQYIEQAEFALALWNDMGFPAADAKAKEGTDVRWMGRYLSAARDKLAAEK